MTVGASVSQFYLHKLFQHEFASFAKFLSALELRILAEEFAEFVKESEREVFRNLCSHQPPPFLFSKTSAKFRKEIFVI